MTGPSKLADEVGVAHITSDINPVTLVVATRPQQPVLFPAAQRRRLQTQLMGQRPDRDRGTVPRLDSDISQGGLDRIDGPAR
jgi:hypothetical protein